MIVLAIGFGGGVFFRRRVGARYLSAVEREREALEARLAGERALGEKRVAAERAEAERRRRYREENDLSDAGNQLRFVGRCALRAVPPVNKEAAQVLYALNQWTDRYHSDWRIGFEVGMGSFIRTAVYDPDGLEGKAAFNSYNSKRVDFLLIDRYGVPRLAIEYHGSGHYLSGDAEARMRVKRLVLEKAGVPLLELPERMSRSAIVAEISRMLEGVG